jgi:DNA adenine methylase
MPSRSSAWAAYFCRYDRAETLFYLDPPYWGTEDYYGKDMFGRADFERLAAVLRDVQGRFILSINDRPEVRQVFDGFAITEISTTYSVRGGGHSSAAAELIITNVPALGFSATLTGVSCPG